MVTRNSEVEPMLGSAIPFGSVWWFVDAGISAALVLFAGIMSGLTLGLMSLGLVELEILQRSGTPAEKKQAGSILFSCYFFLISVLLHGIARSFVEILPPFYACYMCLAAIFPVVQKQHQLLVTLLLCNAAAMEVSI